MYIVWKKKVMTDEKILQQVDGDQADRYQIDDPRFDKLRGEMYVARRSQVSDETRKRYYGFFEQVQTKSILAELTEALQALLMGDSRHLSGARGATSYRLHYAAEQAEIELFVEPQGQHRKIQGDVFGKDSSELGTALVQIQLPDSYEIAHETTSNESGRFSLENVNGGNCLMIVTPATGPAIEVALELT